jgi:cell division topological specificity factor
MFSLLKKILGNEKTGEVAKNRLKVVIMQDRTTFSPHMMEALRQDLIKVFEKYLEIEEDGLEFNLEKEDESVGLAISIPIKKVKLASECGIDEKK